MYTGCLTDPTASRLFRALICASLTKSRGSRLPESGILTMAIRLARLNGPRRLSSPSCRPDGIARTPLAISATRACYSVVPEASGSGTAPEPSLTEGERGILSKLERRFEGGRISVQDISGAQLAPAPDQVNIDGWRSTQGAVGASMQSQSHIGTSAAVGAQAGPGCACCADRAHPQSRQYDSIGWSTKLLPMTSRTCTASRYARLIPALLVTCSHLRTSAENYPAMTASSRLTVCGKSTF